MAVAGGGGGRRRLVGQEEAGGAEGPDGRGGEAEGGMAGSQMWQWQWGKEGQMAGEERNGWCRVTRWQLLGVVGVAGGWQGPGVQDGASQRPDQRVRVC